MSNLDFSAVDVNENAVHSSFWRNEVKVQFVGRFWLKSLPENYKNDKKLIILLSEISIREESISFDSERGVLKRIV